MQTNPHVVNLAQWATPVKHVVEFIDAYLADAAPVTSVLHNAMNELDNLPPMPAQFQKALQIITGDQPADRQTFASALKTLRRISRLAPPVAVTSADTAPLVKPRRKRRPVAEQGQLW
jgi:hypothetical protein